MTSMRVLRIFYVVGIVFCLRMTAANPDENDDDHSHRKDVINDRVNIPQFNFDDDSRPARRRGDRFGLDDGRFPIRGPGSGADDVRDPARRPGDTLEFSGSSFTDRRPGGSHGGDRVLIRRPGGTLDFDGDRGPVRRPMGSNDYSRQKGRYYKYDDDWQFGRQRPGRFYDDDDDDDDDDHDDDDDDDDDHVYHD